MKICICTTPIRNVPTSFPPFGSMALVDEMNRSGEDVEFYNIDYHRPAKEDVKEYFSQKSFAVVGISDVVSTAYLYTKELVGWIKAVSPETVVVVGGNLAASAEILLRLCLVDFCVIDDGEQIFKKLVEVLRSPRTDGKSFETIKGLAYLDGN